jgi:hypothetical protein
MQSSTLYVEVHMRELLAQAERDRLGRRARVGRPLRQRVGAFLIAAGEALAGPPLGAANVEDCPPPRRAPA